MKDEGVRAYLETVHLEPYFPARDDFVQCVIYKCVQDVGMPRREEGVLLHCCLGFGSVGINKQSGCKIECEWAGLMDLEGQDCLRVKASIIRGLTSLASGRITGSTRVSERKRFGRTHAALALHFRKLADIQT